MTMATLSVLRKVFSLVVQIGVFGGVGATSLFCVPCLAQSKADEATINSSIASDGTGTIIVEARGKLPDPPVFYTGTASSTAKVGPRQIEQDIQMSIKVIQGDAKKLSFGLHGDGQVIDALGEGLLSWSVRQVESRRFLDLQLKEGVKEIEPKITIRSTEWTLPAAINLPHLAPGESIGFHSTVSIEYAAEVEGTVTKADGFSLLDGGDSGRRYQTTTGGNIRLSVNRSGASPAPVELVDSTLSGDVDAERKSVGFQLRSTAIVAEDDSEITILFGNAAVSEVPKDANYRLRLSTADGHPVYKLAFARAGTYPIALDFVASLVPADANGRSMDFTIAASAVVPLTLSSLDADLQFHRDTQSVVPVPDGDAWVGFLPATGRAKLQWKTAREAGEGKLFFTTSGQVEARVGTGLLRQDHHIDYQVLQGELNTLSILLRGPGEILDVQGGSIVGWKVSGEGEERKLDITLSQPITGTQQVHVRSQTPLGAFPVRVDGLRLMPVGAIRHSGISAFHESRIGAVGTHGSERLDPVGAGSIPGRGDQGTPGICLSLPRR